MKKYILFDLDGTLTDSAPGFINGVIYAVDKFGIDEHGKDLSFLIGTPVKRSFHEYYGLSKEDAEKAYDHYCEYYMAKGLYENEVYEGIVETLEGLKERGKTLMIATSKPEPLAIGVLEHFDLMKYFSFVGAYVPAENRTSKIAVLKYVLEENHITDLSKVLMVGDRYNDVEGAHAVGVECAGVLFGYGDREEMEKCGADYILETAQELLDIV